MEEKFSKEFIEKIFVERQRDKLTYKDIYNKYGIHIEYWFKKYGFLIPNKKAIEIRNKLSELNWDGKFIENEWQAYYVGLMMSDGTISEGNRCAKLKLAIKDGEENLLNYLQTKLEKNPSGLKTEKNNLKLIIYSTEFVDNLEKLGIYYNKTYKDLHIPIMKENLLRHFIRGYFDGDGTVFYDRQYLKSNICSISKTILEEIQTILSKYNIESAINVEIREGKNLKLPQGTETTSCKNMYRLYVRKQESLKRFKEFLYKDSTVCLIRKFKKFYLDDPELTLKLKNFNVVQRIESEPLN